MNYLLLILIAAIIILWFGRLFQEMGLPNPLGNFLIYLDQKFLVLSSSKNKDITYSSKKEMISSAKKRIPATDDTQEKTIQEKKKYFISDKPALREYLSIFLICILFRIGIYLISLIFLYLNSDATTFTLQDFLNGWNHWDAPHYIELAQNGYAAHVENGQHLFLVFFPLYPWLLRIAHIFIRNWEVACLVLSTLSYAIGCVFFFITIHKEFCRSIAYKSLILISVFPFAFFFGGMMTESLFFCTMSIGFYFIQKHNWLAVGIVGIFCTLCRVQGILILGVAGVEFLTAYPLFTMIREKKGLTFVKLIFTKGIFLLLIPIGNLIYLYINYRVEGNPFQFSIYQKEHWYHSTTLFTKCLSEILSAIHADTTTNSIAMSIWIPELFFFFVALLLILYGLIKQPLKYTAFLLVYTLLNYSVTFLISGGRYMLCAFPMFLFGATLLDKHPKAFHILEIVSAAAMTVFLIGYLQYKQIM